MPSAAMKTPGNGANGSSRVHPMARRPRIYRARLSGAQDD
jgi:hypothetical protein